jgi:hypothetical protein
MSDGDGFERRFQMTLSEDTAEWLEDAYPDALNPQEAVRMAISEARIRRRVDQDS